MNTTLERDIYAKLIQEVREELSQAENEFQYADPELVEAVVYRIIGLQKKLNVLFKKVKEMEEEA